MVPRSVTILPDSLISGEFLADLGSAACVAKKKIAICLEAKEAISGQTMNITLDLEQNSIDFFQEGTGRIALAKGDLTNDGAWKYSILHLVQAIELLLKMRLAQEHELLLQKHIDNPNSEITVGLKETLNRLSITCPTLLLESDRKFVLNASKLRNRITHSSFDVSAKHVAFLCSKLVAFYLDFYTKIVSGSPENAIPDRWLGVVKIANFGQEVFERSRAELDAINDNGEEDWPYVESCNFCGWDALVIDEDYSANCRVCQMNIHGFVCEASICQKWFPHYECNVERGKSYCEPCYLNLVSYEE